MTEIETPGVETSLLRGWRVLTLQSPELRLQLLPDLGATIVSLTRRADGCELLYRTPWGPPGVVTPIGSAEETRSDTDPGGWQCFFPNAGDNAIVNGVEWGVDGEARIAAFDQLSEDSDSTVAADASEAGRPIRVVLGTRLRRTPFRLTRTVTVCGPEVRLSETVEHCGSAPTEVVWANRLAFGQPLIGAATEIDCGATVVHPDSGLNYDVDYADVSPWPRTPGPDSMINLRYLPEPGSGVNRLAYLTDLDAGWVSISNPDIDCRVRLQWDHTVWPHLWYELEDGGTVDHPWFGTERFLAMTPSSGWPARGVHDIRRISRSSITLSPGERRTGELTLRVEHS